MTSVPKFDKVMEAAMALLQSTDGGELRAVPFLKALFYSDLIALRDLGKTITGRPYIALHQGPVISGYPKKVTGRLRKAGLAVQVEEGMAKPIRVTKAIETFQHLSHAELEILQGVAAPLATLTSKEASDFSHENIGWQVAYAAGQGQNKNPLPVNMLLAMQQLADDDDWLSSDLDDDTRLAANEALGAEHEWI